MAFLSMITSARGNLVPNGSFETFSNDVLSQWTIGKDRLLPRDKDKVFHNDRGVSFSMDSSEDAEKRSTGVGSGSHAVRLHSEGGSDDYGILVSERFPLLPGYDYEMSVVYRASGLTPENLDRAHYSALHVDLYMERRVYPRRVGFERIKTSVNTENWVKLDQFFSKKTTRVRVPEGTEWGVVRPQLVNKCPGAATVWIDSIKILPADITLPNGGFETSSHKPAATPASSGEVKEPFPDSWTAYGSAAVAWSDTVFRSGARSVSVSNAGDGAFSGVSTIIPVRPDRSYAFSGYIKGGDLNPDGVVGGGALTLEFLDEDRQPVGSQKISPAVAANTTWTQVQTPAAIPPPGAVMARLVAGLRFCRGSAWFDDLSLTIETAVSQNTRLILRPSPKPSSQITYADNLIRNGTVEEIGSDGMPVGWTYHGKSVPDWSPKEVKAYYDNGRPDFSIGRGQGEVSHTTVYSGKNALLNISIPPPLFTRSQWHAYGPVDGYWLSAPAPCWPGKPYLASAWLRLGYSFGASMWQGPLEVCFYDQTGKRIPAARSVRSGIGKINAGEWTHFSTLPYIAPSGAVSLRLRFGHEFHAVMGGQGRSFGDNFAVWQLPDDIPLPDTRELTNNNDAYYAWFRSVTATIRPPYMPAPVSASAYESVRAQVENSTPGNLYFDPNAPAVIRFALINLIGEDRSVSIKTTRYDAWGNVDGEPVLTGRVNLPGASTAQISIEFPPTKKHGAWYLESEVMEGEAPVGKIASRYAVLPPLNPERLPNNPVFAVTVLRPVAGDKQNSFEQELGTLLNIAGFGTSWLEYHYNPDAADILRTLPALRRQIDWYRAHGMQSVVRLQPVRTNAPMPRPMSRDVFENAGRIIGRELNGQVAALGNWGVEQANSASPFRGGGKTRWTDTEYDTILSAQYDGIKAAAPDLTVLVGNIATDVEAKTIRRLYGPPGNGKFDGIVMNAYMSPLNVVKSAFKEFDLHGDVGKTVWWEENADQQSPISGESRRYGEIEGAKEMVRTWLGMIGKLGPRLKTVTMWGFVRRHEENIVMVTPTLQPRPHYVAHAIMADALRQTVTSTDLSADGLSIYEWQRPEGALITAWSNAGEGTLSLEAPGGEVIVTDILGNARTERAIDGVATLKLDTYPVYITSTGALSLSRRIEARLSHGTRELTQKGGAPLVTLTVKNNDSKPIIGEIHWDREFNSAEPSPINLDAGGQLVLAREARSGLPAGKRSAFRVEIKTVENGIHSATSALNFAFAARLQNDAPVTALLDGTWDAWRHAPVIPFGIDPDEIVKTDLPPNVIYAGPNDIQGKLRLMWDSSCLYLGIEAIDDKHVVVPERGRRGFMGDSIELGIQPDGRKSIEAPYFEYEIYRPADASSNSDYVASRRLPPPAVDISHWKATVKPTGQRGNVNYQIAIPWADLGVANAQAGRVFSMALVLNDADRLDRLSGNRKRVRWFNGIDRQKNTMGFGDVVLVNAPLSP